MYFVGVDEGLPMGIGSCSDFGSRLGGVSTASVGSFHFRYLKRPHGRPERQSPAERRPSANRRPSLRCRVVLSPENSSFLFLINFFSDTVAHHHRVNLLEVFL